MPRVDAYPESRVHNSQPHGIGRVVALDGLWAWNNLGRNVVFAGEDLPAASGVRRVRVLGGRAVSVRPRRPRDPRRSERGHRRDAEPPRHGAGLSVGRRPATGAAAPRRLRCGRARSLRTSSAWSSSAIASSDRGRAKKVLPVSSSASGSRRRRRRIRWRWTCDWRRSGWSPRSSRSMTAGRSASQSAAPDR